MKKLLSLAGLASCLFSYSVFAAVGDRIVVGPAPAFDKITSAGAKISAKKVGDTLKLVAGANITISGNDSTNSVTISSAGLSGADKTKLDGIQAGATANSSDAALLSRSNHTGTQAISTVSGLQTALDGKEPANVNIQSHIGSTSNPHSVTKTQVGLGNVDNTSDLNKPVSTAQQTALNLKMDKSGGTFTGAITGPSFTSNSADGTHYVDTANTADTDTTGWGASEEGRFWYNKTSDKFRYWNGSAATDWAGGASSLGQLSDWPSGVTSAEVGYLDGVTSGIQGQIDNKQSSLGYTAENAANKDTDVTLAANSDTKYPSQKAVKTYVDALATYINNLTTAMITAGIDTTPPILTRNAPVSASPTSTTNSLVINYTTSDPQGMAASTPLKYSINGGGTVVMTSGADSTLTGFTANVATPVVVTATNAAGMTTTDTLSFTYQAPDRSINPTSKAFADTNTGASSVAQNFTITNTGLANLTLSPGLSLTGTDAGQFALSKGTCTDGATITPSGTCTASVTFSPTTAGAKTASLLVDSNAADVTASLSGTGTLLQFSDSFTGTDGTLLTTHNNNWTEISATTPISGFNINNNQLRTIATFTLAGAFYNGSNSDISQALFPATTSTDTSLDRRVLVRAAAGNYGYQCVFTNASGGNWTKLVLRKNAGYLADLAVGSWSMTAPHTVKITASGTSTVTIRGYVDGTQVGTYSDSSSPIVSGHPGIYIGGGGTVANNLIDDWQDY